MKKLFISFLTVIMLSFSLYSQDVIERSNTDYSSNKIDQVVNTLFDKTTEAVKDLANALKVPAEHVYSILIKQQIVKSVTNLFIIILLCLLSYIVSKVTLKSYKDTNISYRIEHKILDSNYNRYELDDNGWWVMGITTVAVLIISTIITFVSVITSVITGFINPEYGAIKDILQYI